MKRMRFLLRPFTKNKKLLVVLFFNFLLSISLLPESKAALLTTSTYCYTQAQVDALAAYTGTAPGVNLIIWSSTNITNLNAMSSWTTVGGYLGIQTNSALTNLDGLSSLASVGEYLYIYSNTALTDFCGLYNLVYTGGLAGDPGLLGEMQLILLILSGSSTTVMPLPPTKPPTAASQPSPTRARVRTARPPSREMMSPA